MNKRKPIASLAVLATIVAGASLACGGGDADIREEERASDRITLEEAEVEESTSSQTEGQTPRVPRNALILYLMNSQSSSSYLAEYGITLKSGRQTIIRLLPGTGEVAQVASNVNASYASSSIRPYTVDGRFFVVRHTGLETNDSHEFSEKDPRTNEQILHFTVSDPINRSCVAILGDDYYYQSYSTFDPLYGHRDGEFKRLRIQGKKTAERELLMEADDPQRCQGNLESSDGVLYDAWQDEGEIEFYRRDLATGKVAEMLGGVTLSDPGQYDDPMEITFDDGMT